MSDVPNDVFREVLTRVPAETLFVSRSVCKAWCKIIDDPDFAKLHFNRGLGDEWLIIRNSTGKVFLLGLNHIITPSPKKHVATNIKNMVGHGVPRLGTFPVPTCNGLILISTCKKNLVWLVWNPFTGEILEIPQCDEFPIVKAGHSDRPYSGIGYNEANDDCKVVRIVHPHTSIYSLSTKSWCRIEGFPDFDVWMYDKNGAFAYGTLHWVVCTRDRVPVGWVVALDLSAETYRTIPIPSEITDPHPFLLELYAFGDDLFLSYSKLYEHYYVVWMIKDYGRENTWVKVISVKQTGFSDLLRPIAYLKRKGLFLLHGTLRDELFWYDVDKKCSTRVSLDNRDHFSFQVSPISLVRLSKNDASYEGVISEGTSKRKRKRALADRLRLKTIFGSSEGW